MEIGGFQKFSVNNYPGFISAVVFTQGCNFHCHYCHNKQLIPCIEGNIQESYVLEYLEEHKDFLDGVVISGGEPTLQPDLSNFLQRLRNMNFLIKLDTNGSFDEITKELIEADLLDYIALDIKSMPEDYHEFSGDKKTRTYVLRTLDYLRESEMEYELRTTSPEKPSWINKILIPGEKWYWQKEM